MTPEELGANFLDSAYPGWFHKIDVHNIDMEHYSNCILGQLYGDYFDGLNCLDEDCLWAKKHGFDSYGHQQRWIKEINKRKTQTDCPTKEQILEAAKESTVKKALEKLFPNVFNSICLDDITHITSSEQAEKAGIGVNSLCVRGCGNFAKKGFYLSDCVDWKIVKDNLGCLVLVPEKKQ